MKQRIILLLAVMFILCTSETPFAETTDPRFPMGTMGEPEGTIAVVSIFADDAKFDWDLDRKRDQQAFAKAYEFLEADTEYLTKQIAKYGRKVRFIWDWEENEELAYTASFKTNLGAGINSSSAGVFEADEIIKENIDTDSIMKSTGADNIIYLFFINSNGSESNSPCAFWAGIDPADSQKDYYYMYEKYGEKAEPYEFCFIFMGQAMPGLIAHEMIHTFATPDLYGESNFGVTEEFAEYLRKNKLNDIMRSEESSSKRGQKRVTGNITEITAYYMGLIDECEFVEEFGLKPSTHTKEYSAQNKVPETKFVDIPIFDPSGELTFFDSSAASSGGEAPKASVFTSELLGGKQIPIETDALTIADEDGDEDNVFPVTLSFSVKGNNALKISAVMTFDEDLMEEEQLETPRVKKSRNKITYDGVAYGITFTVTGTKTKGSFTSGDEELMMHAFKATGNYAAVLLNALMED